MRECTEEVFLKDVEGHTMTVLRNDGLFHHLRFRQPDNSVIMGFDLITWPGHLCYTGDMGTYVFARTPDMFGFFRTSPLTKEQCNGLFINPSYWSEKVLAADKNGKIEEYVEKIARVKLIEALKEMGGTREDRRTIYDDVTIYLDEDERSAKDAIVYYFPDAWEWHLTDFTYQYLWCCYAIAWGIQQHDNSTNKQEN